MNATLRKWLISVGVVLAVIAIVFLAIVWIVRSSFPQMRGSIPAKGLQAQVDVLRDRFGVPHIRAASMHDLYFAQGYITAQDRFWQMDFWRHIGAGRLSEYFGKSTLGTDMYLRTVGFRRAAENDYKGMDPDARKAFDWYAEGVNAYISARTPSAISLEYALLQLQGVKVNIEPWVSLDSMTWLKAMAQDLGGNMRRELYTMDLVQKMGLARTRDFFGTFRYNELPVIVSDSELPRQLLRGGIAHGPAARRSFPLEMLVSPPGELAITAGTPWGVMEAALRPLALGSGLGIGSNDWVISGTRTASGKPILANDPHLGIQMPSIWYETDLYCTALDAQPGKNEGAPFHVSGFSFAGVPGVIIGHNDRIAWGVTNVNPDVQDLYQEKVNPENPNQYEVNGKWVDMAVRAEAIKVNKQDDPTVILVRETRHGPVITDSSGFAGYKGFGISPAGGFPAGLDLRVLSLRWTAFQVNHTFGSVVQIDKARNWKEFRDALRFWDIPSQNFVYADVDGNIGYQTPGLIPVRSKGNGTVPSPGWTDDYEWKGFVPFDSLPFSYNPPKGYIVTANNPVTTPSYKYFISDDFSHGYRARRIAELIEGARGKLTVGDVGAIQADTLNLSAREVMPFLKALTLDGDAARGRDLLLKWDMRMDAASAGAAVYAYFWQALVEEVFKAKVPAALWNRDALLEDNSRLMNSVAELLPDPAAPFWDNPATLDVHENRDGVLATALQKGMKAGIKRLGKDIGQWKWGTVHTALFRNQTFGDSGIRPVEAIFNRGPVPVGGGMQQVSSSDWNPEKPFDTRGISSMRMIVDLSDFNASVELNATGQSGHVGNRHYSDMIKPWALIRYHAVYWDDAALKKAGLVRLVLQPPKAPGSAAAAASSGSGQ
jgi:penicillin G amidase